MHFKINVYISKKKCWYMHIIVVIHTINTTLVQRAKIMGKQKTKNFYGKLRAKMWRKNKNEKWNENRKKPDEKWNNFDHSYSKFNINARISIYKYLSASGFFLFSVHSTSHIHIHIQLNDCERQNPTMWKDYVGFFRLFFGVAFCFSTTQFLF